MNMSTQYRPFTYDHYRHILRCSLEAGYRFIGYSELRGRPGGESAFCLLRHDCDNDLTAAARMARIEEEMGVRSTYFVMLRSALYNLMSIPNAELVREIIGRGHWLGLHFDEMYYGAAAPGEVAARADREREWVSQEFGVPVDAVSFHQPSRRVLDNEVRLNCLNTYDRADMEGVYYLSDSCMVWKEGCPSEFFTAKRRPRLQLLIHPEWWTEEEKTVAEKWNQMLENNFELMQQSMLGRESSYNERQRVEFRP